MVGCVGNGVGRIAIIVGVKVGRTGVKVNVGMGVSVGAGVVADTQAANITAKNVMNIIFFIFTPLSMWLEIIEGFYCILSLLWSVILFFVMGNFFFSPTRCYTHYTPARPIICQAVNVTRVC